MKYLAMINMPGYMPDNPPDAYETKAQALEALYDAIERHAEEDDIPENEMRDAIEHVAIHHFVYFKNMFYGVQES